MTTDEKSVHNELRVSAYAVCLREDPARGTEVLLTHFVNPREPDDRHWVVPGGGIDHGEDPYDATIRELVEETGYEVEIDALIGTDSRMDRYPRGVGRWVDLHAVRVYYAAHIVGGELRDEVEGTTDRAAWFTLDEVTGLVRDVRVDAAIEMALTRPPTGRIGWLAAQTGSHVTG